MRNNSRSRKELRKTRAETRANHTFYYAECGHWHTVNGSKRCNGWVPIRKEGPPY